MKWPAGAEADGRHARRTGTALLVAALGLTVWLVYLGAALPDQGPAQDWSTTWTGIDTWQLTWVGLDVFEVAGLAATGYLLRRSHRQTRTAALLAAPVFIVDGWFDMLTAASRSDLALSLALLAIAELPAAVFLLLVARQARQFEVWEQAAVLDERRPDREHADQRALPVCGSPGASPALNYCEHGRCDSAKIFAMPEKLTLINPPGLHPTSGYAHVTVAEAGRTAHLAGLCPLDAEEVVVGVGDLDAQIDQVVANGMAILAAVGATPADVVRSVIYVVSSESRVLGGAWERLMASELAPALATASTLLGVACLGYTNQLVEIDLTAAL